jgi:hypothetical protein
MVAYMRGVRAAGAISPKSRYACATARGEPSCFAVLMSAASVYLRSPRARSV